MRGVGSLDVRRSRYLPVTERRDGKVPIPAAHAWAETTRCFGGATVAMTLAAGRGSPSRRAGFLRERAAAVMASGGDADEDSGHDPDYARAAAMLSDWQVYALVIASIASGLLAQAALHTGPLSVSPATHGHRDPDFHQHSQSRSLRSASTPDNVAVIALAACSFLALLVGAAIIRTVAISRCTMIVIVLRENPCDPLGDTAPRRLRMRSLCSCPPTTGRTPSPLRQAATLRYALTALARARIVPRAAIGSAALTAAAPTAIPPASGAGATHQPRSPRRASTTLARDA